ncbi:MAG: YbhB/YbcL family Raf kinase inhibitor-like protein [Bacteroidota bacterium]
MHLTVSGYADSQPIPTTYAFGQPDADTHVALAPNRSPDVRWSDAPAGTQSFALIIVDVDVPSVGDDVNQEGKTVPEELPRVDFYHWVLVDIPTTLGAIPEGAASDGVTPGGKPVGPTAHGTAGQNDYTGWFAGNPEMAGTYGGYDGPGPPWNDARVHRYRCTLYALDVDTLGLDGAFGGADALEAMHGHILAQATTEGTYTLNPDLR